MMKIEGDALSCFACDNTNLDSGELCMKDLQTLDEFLEIKSSPIEAEWILEIKTTLLYVSAVL